MRAVYTVGLRRSVPGAKDSHGNVRAAWADPVDLDVFGIAPSTSEEPGDDRTAVTTGLSLLVPPGASIGPLDRVVIDGVEWQVEGEVADYTRGPFGYAPGAVVNLTRSEG